jgi:PAS domain S-box-containing protein
MLSDRFPLLMDGPRLAAVSATGLPDDAAFAESDRILDLAARCLRVPCAAFLLLTGDGFLRRGSFGLPPALEALEPWPLEWAFLLEAAFLGTRHVTDPAGSGFPPDAFRSFLGTPVEDAEGNLLGLLSFWDPQPRAWSEADEVLAAEFAVTLRGLLAGRSAATSIAAADRNREWTNEALIRSRRELDVVLKTMDSACTAQDIHGQLLYANDAAARILDFPNAELLMKTDSRVIMERFDVLDEHRRPFPLSRFPGRIALLGKPVSGTLMCYRVKATGEERWSLVNATPVFDAQGNVRMAINIFNDITPIKRAEAETKLAADSMRKHLRYLEAANQVSAAMERTLEVERVMPAVLAKVLDVFPCGKVWLVQVADSEDAGFRIPFWAHSPGPSRAERPGEMLPQESGFAGIASAAQASDGPAAFGGDHPLPHPGFWRDRHDAGSILALALYPQPGKPWVLCLLNRESASSWPDDDKELLKDIGQRISAVLGSMLLYRDLRRSEEKYRTLFERSLDGIYRCAPDGTILDANPSLVEMLGYASRGDLVGMLHQHLLPSGGEIAGIAAGGLSGGHPAHPDHGEAFTVQLTRKDGETVWVEINTQPIRRQNGEIVYFEGIVRNVNDRKLTEEALKASEERLRQSLKMEAVGRLAGGVAHDFNNLLTAINGFSDLLLMSFPKEDARRIHIEEIRKAGSRAAGLTSQLLSFSRKQVLAPRQLDLNEVISGMETMLRRLIGENIEFRTKLDPDLAKVVADPNQMEQVILNLILNARDAMPGGGELFVATTNARVEADPTGAAEPNPSEQASSKRKSPQQSSLDLPAGEYAVIEVRDTGFGMDAETKARLFEPFFTTKGKDKGTGLGLSTVYGAVKQANGSIGVESEPERGTLFTIHLPVSTRPDRPSRRSREKIKNGAGGTETILLVEDEDAVRRLVRDVLKVNGYDVLEANGGEQALEIARRKEGVIHLLLTDVVMGGMSGRELAEELRPERPDVKMLFMSGYTEDAIIRHGVLTAHTAFIAKPFSPAAIASKVREVLDNVQEKSTA